MSNVHLLLDCHYILPYFLIIRDASGVSFRMAAAGVTLSEGWFDYRVVTIDRLGEEFLNYIEEGCMVEIKPDGQVAARIDSLT